MERHRNQKSQRFDYTAHKIFAKAEAFLKKGIRIVQRDFKGNRDFLFKPLGICLAIFLVFTWQSVLLARP